MGFICNEMILLKSEVFNMQINDDLPNQLNEILNETIQKSSDAFPELIKQGGYVPPRPDLLYDAIAALSMGKNILLKGPTGTGKTKRIFLPMLKAAMASYNKTGLGGTYPL